NWMTSRISDSRFTLTGSYPLNSRPRSGGTHIWVMDISAEVKGTEVRWRAELRGSNAAGVNQSSAMPLPNGGMRGALAPLAQGDVTLPLPANLDLARLGGKTFSIGIEP